MIKDNILLCIGYDGSDFCGYQKQLHERTVQGCLEKSLSDIFQQDICTYSAGRTDAGVHAEKQFVNFKIDTCHIPFEKISFAVNSLLPHDIRIFWSKKVPDDFHARYSAITRKYYYQVHEGTVLPPTMRRYAYSVPKNLDWNRIQLECNELLGEHDFSAFSAHNNQVENCVRNILRIEVKKLSQVIRIYVEGNAFLWKMVRVIVGTVVEREVLRIRNKPIEMSISDILKSKNRDWAGTTAPPWALFLYDVIYDERYGIAKHDQ